MTDKTEFTITLLSNARGDVDKNTLSSFTNNLPNNLNFNQQDDWHVSLDGLGFSTKFYNIKNDNKPSFRLITRKRVTSLNTEKMDKMTDFYVKAGYEKSFVESLLVQPANFGGFLSHDFNIFRGKREAAEAYMRKVKEVDFSASKKEGESALQFMFLLMNAYDSKKLTLNRWIL